MVSRQKSVELSQEEQKAAWRDGQIGPCSNAHCCRVTTPDGVELYGLLEVNVVGYPGSGGGRLYLPVREYKNALYVKLAQLNQGRFENSWESHSVPFGEKMGEYPYLGDQDYLHFTAYSDGNNYEYVVDRYVFISGKRQQKLNGDQFPDVCLQFTERLSEVALGWQITPISPNTLPNC